MQVRFERGDRACHECIRYFQLLGRAPEALCFGDPDKDPHGVDLIHGGALGKARCLPRVVDPAVACGSFLRRPLRVYRHIADNLTA